MSFLDIFALNLHDDDDDGDGDEDDDAYDDHDHAEYKQHMTSTSTSEPPFPPIVHTLSEALHHISQPIERTVSDYESKRNTSETQRQRKEYTYPDSYPHHPHPHPHAHPHPNYFLVTYLRFIKNTIHNHMGNMAQCRINSTPIREGGGIESLMTILHTMIHVYLPMVTSMVETKVKMGSQSDRDGDGDVDGDEHTCSNEHIEIFDKDQATRTTNSTSTSADACTSIMLEEVYGLTIAALGALRDLACGNAQNRLLVGQFTYSHSHSHSHAHAHLIKVHDSCDTTSDMDINDMDLHSSRCATRKGTADIGTRPDSDTDTDTYRMTGIEIISHFVQKHDGVSWEKIVSLPRRDNIGIDDIDDNIDSIDSIDRWELKTMTNALGVIRNISHSTPFNCQGLHQVGMTLSLINRLLCVNGNRGYGDEIDDSVGKGGSTTSSFHTYTYTYTLPDVSKPWREACYRTAGSLINMAERCHDVAVECGQRDDGGALILILIQSWGGFDLDQMLNTCSGTISENNVNGAGGSNSNGEDKTISSNGNGNGKNKGKKGKKACPVLHVGLWNILNVRIEKEKETNFNFTNKMVVDGIDLMVIIRTILEREEKRKQTAQARENARKKAKAKQSKQS